MQIQILRRDGSLETREILPGKKLHGLRILSVTLSKSDLHLLLNDQRTQVWANRVLQSAFHSHECKLEGSCPPESPTNPSPDL